MLIGFNEIDEGNLLYLKNHRDEIKLIANIK